MNPVVKLVALVTVANVIVQGDRTNHDLDAILAEYCRDLEFIDEWFLGPVRVKQQNAMAWCRHLQEEGVERVRMYFRPSTLKGLPLTIPPELAMYGSNWLIETQYSKINRLYAVIPNARDMRLPKKWSIYLALREGACLNLEDNSPTLPKSRENLKRVLNRLIRFSKKLDSELSSVEYWSQTFDRCKRILLGTEPRRLDDFILQGIYSTDAQQLLQASIECFSVFDGLSSWNEIEREESCVGEHASLSMELYRTICESITSVTNRYRSDSGLVTKKS